MFDLLEFYFRFDFFDFWDGEKNISVSLLQTLNTSFDNVSDLFFLHQVIILNMDNVLLPQYQV